MFASENMDLKELEKQAFKRDKTISFRVTNEIYQVLKNLSQQSDKSINVYARECLGRYLSLKYPEELLELIRVRRSLYYGLIFHENEIKQSKNKLERNKREKKRLENEMEDLNKKILELKRVVKLKE